MYNQHRLIAFLTEGIAEKGQKTEKNNEEKFKVAGFIQCIFTHACNAFSNQR